MREKLDRGDLAMFFVAGLKAFLKAMPGDATVDEILASVTVTPDEELLKFVRERV